MAAAAPEPSSKMAVAPHSPVSILSPEITPAVILTQRPEVSPVSVLIQSVHWAQQRQDWVPLVTRECFQIHHLVPEWNSGNFGHVAGPVSQDNMRLCQAKLSHESLMKRDCRSPTLLTKVSAVRRAVFMERALSLTDSRAQTDLSVGPVKQREIPRGNEVRSWRIQPLRNQTIWFCLPKDLPPTVSWFAAIAAMYILRVEADSRFSRPSWKKGSTDPTVHLHGSSP